MRELSHRSLAQLQSLNLLPTENLGCFILHPLAQPVARYSGNAQERTLCNRFFKLEVGGFGRFSEAQIGPQRFSHLSKENSF